jgi:hypothetical protein
MTDFRTAVILSAGALLALIGATEARERPAAHRANAEYSDFEARADLRFGPEDGLSVRPQPAFRSVAAKPEGDGQPGTP